jgi:hypothetical protein
MGNVQSARLLHPRAEATILFNHRKFGGGWRDPLGHRLRCRSNSDRALSAAPPARTRPSVDLPPCKPHGGVNTNWSGNKCAELSERSSLSVQPTPVVQEQPPKHDEPATADRAVQPDNQAHPSSMTDNLGFDVAVGLGLVLAFALVRSAVLAMIEKPVQDFERDDTA